MCACLSSALKIFTTSSAMVVDGKTTRFNHVPYEKYEELVEETNSLKIQALHREEEIQTLEGMLGQKDKEIVRLEDQLLLRDRALSKLRILIEFAWKEFDSAKKRNPEASAIEKHEEESIREISGTISTVNEIEITNLDGNTRTSAHVPSIQGEPPPLHSTFNDIPQPPPTESKITREIPLTKKAKQDDQTLALAPIFYGGPILSVSKSKGRQPPPPPPLEANFVGATPTPDRKFNVDQRPAPPPPPRPPPPPPHGEANIVGATPTPVRKFNIAPRPAAPPPPPPPPLPMEANIVGATPTPVRKFNVNPRQRPPLAPPPEANIVGATPTPVRKFNITPPQRIEANVTGATQTPLRRYHPNNTITKPNSSMITVAQQDGKPPL